MIKMLRVVNTRLMLAFAAQSAAFSARSASAVDASPGSAEVVAGAVAAYMLAPGSRGTSLAPLAPTLESALFKLCDRVVENFQHVPRLGFVLSRRRYDRAGNDFGFTEITRLEMFIIHR
jgi:hypothetical protein